jgi:methionyl-tRNA formyltransferase
MGSARIKSHDSKEFDARGRVTAAAQGYSGDEMRVIMIGTGGFALPSFRLLLNSRQEVEALVTKPPRPVHGRQKPPVNPMLDVARANGITVVTPDSINSDEAASVLRQLSPDLLVVCDYGQILADRILDIARLGGINLHGSLLPKYRGAAPINWALYHGEEETGITVIHMTRRLDSGPCLVRRSTPIGANETAPELELRLAELGAAAVLDAILMLESWDGTSPIGDPQDPKCATTARRLTKADGRIDWKRSAQQICNQVRAMKPWPGTYTNWHRSTGDEHRLIVERVEVDTDHEAAPGRVIAADRNGILVGTGQHAIRILAIKPEGRRTMTADEFLRGHAMAPGDRLGE